jgi:hypothetical protein
MEAARTSMNRTSGGNSNWHESASGDKSDGGGKLKKTAARDSSGEEKPALELPKNEAGAQKNDEHESWHSLSTSNRQ